MSTISSETRLKPVLGSRIAKTNVNRVVVVDVAIAGVAGGEERDERSALFGRTLDQIDTRACGRQRQSSP